MSAGNKNNRYSRSQLVFYLAGLLPTSRKEALAVIDTLGKVVIASTARRARSVRRQRRKR